MTLVPEMVTMLGGTLLGGLLKISTQVLQNRREEREYLLRAGREQADIYRQAREFRGDSGFSWTRRTIALLAVFFIIVWPKLVVVFYPEIPVAVASPAYDDGFWWWSATYTINQWDWVRGGLMITPLDRQLMAAIVGLFFGSEITKR